MRKFLITLLFMLLPMCMLYPEAEAEAAATFSYNDNGTVRIDYTVAEDITVLVMVENTETDNAAVKYYYKLQTGSNQVDVPLTEGAGTYKIRICKVLAGNRAMLLKSWSTSIDEDGAMDVFRNPSIIVDYELSENVLAKAESLTKNCKTDDAKIKKIYNYVVKNYSYDYELLSTKSATAYYVPDLEETYARKLGICYDISCTIAGMLRHVGVEARVVTGYTPNVAVYHAWNQIYDSEKGIWYTVDGTYDMCMYDSGVTKYTMKKSDSDYDDITYYY